VQAGVKFVLGEPQGKIQSLEVNRDGLEQRVTGIKTCDGLSHPGDLVIMACQQNNFYLIL
jgi:sarcosine oxidase / L-pipecolate oxidase